MVFNIDFTISLANEVILQEINELQRDQNLELYTNLEDIPEEELKDWVVGSGYAFHDLDLYGIDSSNITILTTENYGD